MVVIKQKALFLSAILIFSIVNLHGTSQSENSPIGGNNIELTEEAVSKKTLDNGLTVFAKEIPGRDLVSIHVKIRAGSSLEAEFLGSGISHFVEHMLFKGTKTRKPGDIEREVRSCGAVMNGSVSQDMTAYYITSPTKYFKEAISLLKDILLNATFDETEIIKEREVILSEARMNNDDPQNRVIRLLNENAYLYHTYRYPPIGYEECLRALKRPDLQKYYNRMYVPNRMVITIAGSIDGRDAMSAVEKEFSDFRRSNYGFVDSMPAEPVQIGIRRHEESRSIGIAYVAMGFHSTGVLDKDLFAMDVLAIILGRGDNSRLNSSLLKDKKLVYSVSCWNHTPRYPGLFTVSLTLEPGSMENAEKSVLNEIEKIRKGSISDTELEAAKRMVLSDYIRTFQTLDDAADRISRDYILTGNSDFSSRYVSGVQAVTKDEITRVANIYLTTDSLTIIRLTPLNYRNTAEKPVKTSEAAAMRLETLTNGLRVIVREDKSIPMVSISAAISGGIASENKENNGISNLVSNMLLKGTATRKENAISGAIEERGGQISSFSGLNGFGLRMQLLKADLDLGLDILKDILANSTFPQEEIDKEISLILAEIKEEDNDIYQKSFNSFRRSLFGDNPYGLRYLGEDVSVSALNRNDLLRYYNERCTSINMVLGISGDVEYEALMIKMKNKFGDLRKGVNLPQPIRKGSAPDRIKLQNETLNKEQSLVLIGFQTTDILNEDKYALEVMASIFSGMSGRLYSTLREKSHLAYNLGCVHKFGLETGYLVFYAATSKDNLNIARKGIISQINEMKDKGVSDAELSGAKKELVTNWRLSMQTNDFFSMAGAIDELYGLGYDDLYKYETEIGKVSKSDVKKVADKYLDTNKYAEVTIEGSD